jgi:hypothetical protein
MGTYSRRYLLLSALIHRFEVHYGFNTVCSVRVSPIMDESIRPQRQENLMDGLSSGRTLLSSIDKLLSTQHV